MITVLGSEDNNNNDIVMDDLMDDNTSSPWLRKGSQLDWRKHIGFA